MDNQIRQENAVAAIRVSSIKQGLQGDSPDAQQEQIEQFAKAHNINIKKYFIFMDSASREKQPVQEAIDYCKNPKNGIDLFVIKSIDRFTRGGSYLYTDLKRQLQKSKIKLIDIYGTIGTQEINTLEHLGVKFDWSVYSPTQKSELLEAERAKDEMRDIMSRMIGAEIRYVRMGYRVRSAPFGYINIKAETPHGRRVILKPHPEESQWILKMYDLRLRGTMSDQEIIDEINKLGFKSRRTYVRDPKDRTKILGERGGKKLTVKQYQEYIKNPIYAGVIWDKWTLEQPVKGRFGGLISAKMFNEANKGKIVLLEDNGEVKILKEQPAEWRLRKLVNNPEYPYKKYILCPECHKPLYGSASKGKSGGHFPVYHCDRKHKRFSVPVGKAEETITNFVQRLRFTKAGIEKFKKAAIEEWVRRISENKKDDLVLENKLKQLEVQERLIAEKIMMLTSEVAIKMMEDDLNKIEAEKVQLKADSLQEKKENIPMDIVLEVVGYFLEHFENLLLGGSDPFKKAAYFGIVFEETPTYQDLVLLTPRLAPDIELIKESSDPNSVFARPEGFEPPTSTLEPSCSIH